MSHRGAGSGQMESITEASQGDTQSVEHQVLGNSQKAKRMPSSEVWMWRNSE
jgi:hypothetical protein